MRLFLAAAVVLLVALVAHAEAQNSFEDRITSVRDQVSTLGTAFAEKTTDLVERIGNSDFAQQSKNWLQKRFEDFKNAVAGL